MSKKRSIIIFVIIAVLALLLILSSTIFRVRKQNVIFSAEIDGITAENIISAGEIKNGKSIFLINKNEAKTKIEKAVPYAKVEKIYVTFPNTLNFEISKRTDFAYFERDGEYLICDSSLKVLRTSTEDPSLIKLDFDLGQVAAGDFISNQYVLGMFESFGETISISLDGNVSPEFTLTSEKAIESIEKITFNKESLVFNVKTREGFSVEFDVKSAVKEKHYYLMGILLNESSSILTAEERASGQTFILEKTSSGMRKYVKE